MARSTNGNIAKVSLYMDDISTAAANKVGREETTNREALNAVADILNNEWSTWTPTLAWTGTGCNQLVTVARYKQLGSTVAFHYSATAVASTGIAGTALTISLPVNPKDIDGYHPLCCQELQTGGAYRDAQAYIDMTTGTASERLIRFRNFHSIFTNAYAMHIAGTYEVT